MEGIQIGKKEQLFPFADVMIVYVDNPVGIYENAPGTNKRVNKVAEYKVNTQKSVTFL